MFNFFSPYKNLERTLDGLQAQINELIGECINRPRYETMLENIEPLGDTITQAKLLFEESREHYARGANAWAQLKLAEAMKFLDGIEDKIEAAQTMLDNFTPSA